MGYSRHPVFLLVLFLLPVLGRAEATPTPPAPAIGATLTSGTKRTLEQEARLVVDLLQNYHYSGRAFRDLDSPEMIDRFLDELDPDNDFLTAEDRQFVHRRFDRTLKPVYLYRGDLQPAFEIFDLFSKRARDRLAWIERQLAYAFDFTRDDTYTPPAVNAAPVAAAELETRWQALLRELVLREILAGRSPEDAAAEVARQFQKTRRHIDSFDVLAVRERFFDAIIRSFDPHSGYFSADSAREFAVGMANAVGGIGLDLKKENGRCEIVRIQPGGPADLHSDLRAGDILLALAEGDGPWQDATSQRLREIVARVRGEPGTRLRLAYRTPERADRHEITLERTRVILTAERAHGALSLVPDGTGQVRRIGWIELPAFYAAGENGSETSAAADVRELVEQLQAGGLDGLVIDLRANPGGALPEAVALANLFLPEGNVLLSRPATGTVTEFPVKPGPALYPGPLVVLTSARSASASEVFAGAMKFHRRALLVGEATTFGKGSMQNYIELAKVPRPAPAGAKDWGTLRLTEQRFFQPDGAAVQLNGVATELVLPEPAAGEGGRKRERDLPRALPAENITPPSPARPAALPLGVTPALLADANARLQSDLAELPEWRLWRAEQKQWETYLARQPRSLQETVRRTELEAQRAEWATTRNERRELTRQHAYPTEPCEIAVVRDAYAAHQARLRQRLGEMPAAETGVRLQAGALLFTTDRGKLRQMEWAAWDAMSFYGDRPELATAYNAATGRAIDAEVMARILQEISLLDPRTEAAVLDVFARHGADDSTDLDTIRRGVEACFTRILALEPELTRHRASLDVPLREALRLGALWAGQIAPAAH